MREILTVICLCLASLPCLAGFGTVDQAGMSRFEQRALYLEVIDLIKDGSRSNKIQKIKEQLADYPLYPYIEYTEKIYQISRQSPQSIRDFIDHYSTTPLANQLLENWIFVQAKQGNWSRFVEYYRSDLNGERNACFYAYALYREERRAEAFDAAKKLWLVDHSQPDECDSIFKAWRDAGGLDRDAAWGRFSMSLKANEVALASYLMRYLDNADKKLANNFKLVQQNPNYIRQNKRFPDDDDKTRDAILHGVKRLAVRNPIGAYQTFESYTQTHSFSDEDSLDAWSYIGIRLALDGDTDNLLDSIPIDIHRSPDLIEARIRLALRQLAWSQALILVNLLPEEAQASPRWRFWKARVLAGSADANDQVMSQEIFQRLSTERDFYGFLAADAIGKDYDFEDLPETITEDQILSLELNPGIQRALELFTLGERNRGRYEWYFVTKDFTDQELKIAARVAQKWGWYRQAIRSMINARAWDDLDVRFPLAYYDSFVSNARIWDIPLHWSLAIARQESAFMPDARSSAGAMGIMQLMPATARQTASQHGVDLSSTDELVDPLLNIQLGSAYLGRMLRRFNNNRILASAAYNAGPARVETWLDPSLPLDVWVETIPFTETRNYVQNVLMFSAIYARRLSRSEPLIYAHEFKDFGARQITLHPTIATPAASPDNS